MCTLAGEPFSASITVTTRLWIYDGRECNFDNDRDVEKAAVALAEMHRASKGYVPPGDCKVQDDLGKLPGYFLKRLDDIRKMKKQARRERAVLTSFFSNMSIISANWAKAPSES